jgi:hypothetical protein
MTVILDNKIFSYVHYLFVLIAVKPDPLILYANQKRNYYLISSRIQETRRNTGEW